MLRQLHEEKTYLEPMEVNEEPELETLEEFEYGDETIYLREDEAEAEIMTCPDCGDGELIPSEGCEMCLECGYSPCA